MTTEISVTVDLATLDEVRRLAGGEVDLAGIVSAALAAAVVRLRAIAALREWEQARTAS
jgi:hypothetical protein